MPRPFLLGVWGLGFRFWVFFLRSLGLRAVFFLCVWSVGFRVSFSGFGAQSLVVCFLVFRWLGFGVEACFWGVWGLVCFSTFGV